MTYGFDQIPVTLGLDWQRPAGKAIWLPASGALMIYLGPTEFRDLLNDKRINVKQIGLQIGWEDKRDGQQVQEDLRAPDVRGEAATDR